MSPIIWDFERNSKTKCYFFLFVSILNRDLMVGLIRLHFSVDILCYSNTQSKML